MAYSFELPVLATDVGDFTEMIEENKSGFLTKNNDPGSMAETILKIKSAAQLKEMGKYAKKLSDTKYSWQNIALETYKLYKTLT